MSNRRVAKHLRTVYVWVYFKLKYTVYIFDGIFYPVYIVWYVLSVSLYICQVYLDRVYFVLVYFVRVYFVQVSFILTPKQRGQMFLSLCFDATSRREQRWSETRANRCCRHWNTHVT